MESFGEGYESGCYVKPAIAEADNSSKSFNMKLCSSFIFTLKYSGTVEDALAIQNGVAQGLSIMTNNLREVELFFIGCGFRLRNSKINIGTSGAEIGGAFGGEKRWRTRIRI
jgi:aldehyde dehydrogenase (NAD+)